MGIPVLGLVGDVLDKIIPDANERAKAKILAAQLEQNGEFRKLEIQLSAIIMEAKSKDGFTSRARPSFLYVMYIIILMAFPMAGVYAFNPEIADQLITGFKLFLESIPEPLWFLFGTGYLGYVKKRSDDKKTLLGSTDKTWLDKIF